MRVRAALLALSVVMLAAGCASSPARRYDALAQELGMRREVMPGQPFTHVVYQRGQLSAEQPLHVYLESDGSPWIARTRIAADPTPAEPVALRLLQLDPAPAVLIGRPCYHGMHSAPGCSPVLWTFERYSEAVVASMAAAVKTVARRHEADAMVLIGYSGGGTLAMLIAERLPEVVAVVTLAGNLDIDRWAAMHGYSPLTGSLNPATRPPLPPRIVQLHVAGGRDEKVPVALIEDALKRQPHALLRVLPAADHSCCWEQEWPQILKEMGILVSASAP